jgi:hypothetical protein
MGIRAALLVLVLTGCSFLRVRDTPHTDRFTRQPTCATKAVPAFDLVAASAYVGISALMLTTTGFERHIAATDEEIAMSVVLGAAAVTSIASAIYGFRTVPECRAKLVPPP